jgi:hypothetical protein
MGRVIADRFEIEQLADLACGNRAAAASLLIDHLAPPST